MREYNSKALDLFKKIVFDIILEKVNNTPYISRDPKLLKLGLANEEIEIISDTPQFKEDFEEFFNKITMTSIIRSIMDQTQIVQNNITTNYDKYKVKEVIKLLEKDPDKIILDEEEKIKASIINPDKIQSIIDRQNVAECGPGPMSNMGQDEGNMSINTSMNSDGTKSVSVSATGNQADALAQMLKMAGLAAHHAVHGGEQEPQAVVIQAGPEEQVEEERDVQYANTPDEEVENVDAIMHQGNDLNREKEQYAGMAKAGDNPMATRESIEMPARISRMLAGVKQAKW